MIDRQGLRASTRAAIQQIEDLMTVIARDGAEYERHRRQCNTIVTRLEEALAVTPRCTDTPKRRRSTLIVHDGAGRTGLMWDCKCGETFESRGARVSHIREANR